MRTTLSLDEDVLEKARAVAGQLRVPFKTVVNEALRLGLSEVEKPAKQRRYRTISHAMGRRDGYSVDNVQELLAQAEGEDFR
jgi:hypothetical protein